ncbi:hypothetical protein EJB05_04520, partial [Eragrostis curvula]
MDLLPDCLLEIIVSFLPPKAGARTMALSRRWRSIWPYHPLHVDFSDAQTREEVLGDSSLCAVLSSHRGPIRRFSVTSYPDFSRGAPIWFGALLARKTIIDSVTLELGNELFKPHVPLAANVRRLELRFCRVDLLPSTAPPTSLFPVLECLRLAWVEISETALAGLVDGGCPALRDISLEGMDGLRHVALRSRTLATACISRCRNLDELCAGHAPSLRALTFRYMGLWRIKIEVPISVQEIGLTLPTIGSLVTTSTTTSSHYGCTCLDSWSSKYKRCYRGWPPAAGKIACLNQHLTHVRLQGYCATRGEQEFATFLVSLSMSLTLMEMIHSAHWTVKTIESQKRMLCRRGVASSVAQLRFTKQN